MRLDGTKKKAESWKIKIEVNLADTVDTHYIESTVHCLQAAAASCVTVDALQLLHCNAQKNQSETTPSKTVSMLLNSRIFCKECFCIILLLSCLHVCVCDK